MLFTSTQRSLYISLLLLQISIFTHATIIVRGNIDIETQSFADPIQKFVFNNGRLYIGANNTDAKNFALSIANIQALDYKHLQLEPEEDEEQDKPEKDFIPAAPQKATVNEQKNMVNPLYGKKIIHLAAMSNDTQNYIAVVTAHAPTSICLLETIAQIRTLEHVNDAEGIGAASIVQMAPTSQQIVYAAVTDHANNPFGVGNSGIALITPQKQQPDQDKKQEEPKTRKRSGLANSKKPEKDEAKAAQEKERLQKEQKDAQDKAQKAPTTKVVQLDFKASHTHTEQSRAIPLNNESNVLKIGDSTVTILNNAVNMHWANSLDNLYVALNIQSHGNEGTGCQAIAIVYKQTESIRVRIETQKTQTKKKNTKQNEKDGTDKDKPQFATMTRTKHLLKSITSINAFDPHANNIVGGIGSDITVSIHEVKTLLTSTELDYLVLLGGIGKPEQTRRCVYALPLVKNNNVCNGILAKKHSVPGTFGGQRVTYRAFTEHALKAGDLYTADDVEVQIGHGPMHEGDITSIMVYGDAVYAVVSTADTGHTAGIYQSQAIFDSLGRIKEWTYWRRVYSSFDDHIYGAVLNQSSGSLFMLTGNSYDSIYTIKRTSWENGEKGYSHNVCTWFNEMFPVQQEGIQGLFDFSANTPGLTTSLVCATGYRKVAFVQTGISEQGILNPMAQQELVQNPMLCTNGTINPEMTPETNALSISGGVLNELNIIKAAAITHIDNAGYIFVGGTHGLAVLVNDQGCSFDAAHGLGNNFSGLHVGATFKKIGSYSFVRKLICDHESGLLYVVCDTYIDRIDIKASNFSTGYISVSRLGSHGMIFDAVMSRSLGIIATSNGLYCSGCLADIRTAENSTDVDWQQITLPEGLPATRQIYCVSITGQEQDITTGTGGNVYILNTNQSKQKAQIYRFSINTGNAPYFSLEQLPDYFVKDSLSYFAQLTDYKTWIYNDGALFFNERDKHGKNNMLLTLLTFNDHNRQRFGINSQTLAPMNLQDSSSSQPIVRSSSSGSLLLARNTTFSVHE